MNWAFRCSAHAGFWLKLTPGCRIAGTARPIPILKKSPNPKPGTDLQRRSQLPPGFHLICDLEPSRPAAGGRLVLCDAAHLFQHWQVRSPAERMNSWLSILAENRQLLTTGLGTNSSHGDSGGKPDGAST